MKYMGSKHKIVSQIAPIIQKEIDDNDIHNYLEPFLGGANVIDHIKCEKKFGYDLDKYLINLLAHVKVGESLPETMPKDIYDELRKAWYNNNADDKYPDWLIGCACYLASYNGRDFTAGYAKPGYEKVKGGVRYRDYYKESKANLLKQAENPLFQDIIFGIDNYKNFKNLEGYVIYADPPYASVKQYANSKDIFNHNEFWDIMRQWSEKNIVFISELSAPEDFECIWQQEVSRSIKATDKSRAVEKLFIYKD